MPGQDPGNDLAEARGLAAAHQLPVADQIVDILDLVDARADNPALRRGYARALRLLADPASPVHGMVAVSRTAITLADRPYEDQLLWHIHHHTGLWLVRNESAI
ncbi:hypothetical protein [Streptomyces sp. NPDC002221]|uniref:hypothetical protein n=1 Tax=Streptomyces sp. NPDC002221 TaxID=3364639 RepID=UPI0036B0BBDA